MGFFPNTILPLHLTQRAHQWNIYTKLGNPDYSETEVPLSKGVGLAVGSTCFQSLRGLFVDIASVWM